ncbi:GNAT family N-acetyltransferase [Bradyrhizobium japonicum]|uniref:GNAT family N-acetyltransferase n=1 Tax=Bradyrhizobium japonicum TaxID=375 RepID=UPI0019130A54
MRSTIDPPGRRATTAIFKIVCRGRRTWRRGGCALVEHVYAEARRRGASRVYWSTHEPNHNAMHLYNRIAERSGLIIYRKQFG